jgi:hypothetical protein
MFDTLGKGSSTTASSASARRPSGTAGGRRQRDAFLQLTSGRAPNGLF